MFSVSSVRVSNEAETSFVSAATTATLRSRSCRRRWGRSRVDPAAMQADDGTPAAKCSKSAFRIQFSGTNSMGSRDSDSPRSDRGDSIRLGQGLPVRVCECRFSSGQDVAGGNALGFHVLVAADCGQRRSALTILWSTFCRGLPICDRHVWRCRRRSFVIAASASMRPTHVSAHQQPVRQGQPSLERCRGRDSSRQPFGPRCVSARRQRSIR